jgi:hypothetical protein
MKIIITEEQYNIIKSFLFEDKNVSSKSITDSLVSSGVPRNKINLLKSGYEDSWVLQVVTEKGDILAIQYPALIDEIPSSDKTKVDVIIDNKTKTMSNTLAAGIVSTEYKKRKLPTSRKN